MGEVVRFTGATTADSNPDDILEAAKGHLDTVLIIGVSANGEYYAASSSDLMKMVWMCERAKQFFLQLPDEDD